MIGGENPYFLEPHISWILDYTKKGGKKHNLDWSFFQTFKAEQSFLLPGLVDEIKTPFTYCKTMSSFSLEIHSFTSVTGFSKNTASSSPPKILFFRLFWALPIFVATNPQGFQNQNPRNASRNSQANVRSTSLPFRRKKKTNPKDPFSASKSSLTRTISWRVGVLFFFVLGRFWGCFPPRMLC